MKISKLPVGMTVNHKERKIFVTETLDRKIKAGETSLEELQAVMNTFQKYPKYERILLHFVWLGEIA